MKPISEVLKTILPFKLDNIRELTETDRAILRIQVNNWLKAQNNRDLQKIT